MSGRGSERKRKPGGRSRDGGSNGGGWSGRGRGRGGGRSGRGERGREFGGRGKKQRTQPLSGASACEGGFQNKRKAKQPGSAVCEYFRVGKCTKGSRCKFSHDLSPSAEQHAEGEHTKGQQGGDPQRRGVVTAFGLSDASAAASHHSPRFLSLEDDGFETLLEETYSTFYHQPHGQTLPGDLPTIDHVESKAALKALLDERVFFRNIVRVGKTYIPMAVRRVLLADEGITYLYLGLRLFSIPWNVDRKKCHKSGRVKSAAESLNRLNTALEGASEHLICSKVAEKNHKSAHEGAKYNLALINFMDPLRNDGVDVKPEPSFGMGPMAVAWHRDQYTAFNSSVAVYNSVLREHERKGTPVPWSIGIRKAYDRSKTPGLKVPLLDGDAYYMLFTCNQDTQHCVIEGSSARFSSTHRQGTCDKGTLEYILGQAERLQNLAATLSSSKITAEMVEEAEEIHTEIEFEWIRQFWVQGSEHADVQVFWRPHLKRLELIWIRGEELTAWLVDQVMKEGAEAKRLCYYSTFVRKLKQRVSLRDAWNSRYQLPIYKTKDEWAPLQRPDFSQPGLPLPYGLEGVLSRLQQLAY